MYLYSSRCRMLASGLPHEEALQVSAQQHCGSGTCMRVGTHDAAAAARTGCCRGSLGNIRGAGGECTGAPVRGCASVCPLLVQGLAVLTLEAGVPGGLRSACAAAVTSLPPQLAC